MIWFLAFIAAVVVGLIGTKVRPGTRTNNGTNAVGILYQSEPFKNNKGLKL